MMTTMRLVVASACVLACAACSAPRRPIPDAASETSLCGDGLVEVHDETPEQPFADEECDDGPLNGTPASSCSKQCRTLADFQTQAFPLESFALGNRVGHVVSIVLGGRAGWAFLTPDEPGLHVRWQNWMTSSILQVQSPATSVAEVRFDTIGRLPVWTEGPTGADPTIHMYYADLDNDGQLQAHEIPYPFADGTSPCLLAVANYFAPGDDNYLVVIDQTAAPNTDLLVAWVQVQGPGAATATTLRVPAPGAVRGSVIPSFEGFDHVLDPTFQPSHSYVRFVQFFDDTRSYVTLELRQSFPTPGTDPDRLSEFARGSWPFRVTGGVEWFKDFFGACKSSEQDAGVFSNAAAFTHPYPLMVLTDTGDFYLWQFDGRPPGDGEIPPKPWGHAAPGSVLAGGHWDARADELIAIYVIEPSGKAYVLGDGDCLDPGSNAMKAYVPPISYPPWTSAGIMDGWNGGSIPGPVLDDRAWNWWPG